jgi:hypothetical protein
MPALGSRRSPSSFACSPHRRTTKRLLPPRPGSRFATEPIELLSRYKLLQDKLELIQAEIKASMAELGERGIVPRGTTIRQFRKSSAQPVHQEIT